MTDRPIIFSGPMVRALLEGRKTQTRRVVPRPVGEFSANSTRLHRAGDGFGWSDGRGGHQCKARAPWRVGDRLWVREAHALLPRLAYRGSIGTGTIDQREHPTDGYSAAVFREGFDRAGRPLWRPSIHMPRWASRLTLTVTEVRVERLNSISAADALAEGIKTIREYCYVGEGTGYDRIGLCHSSPEMAFSCLWDEIHGREAWNSNPWVAAITFEVRRENIDALPPVVMATPATRAALSERGGR